MPCLVVMYQGGTFAAEIRLPPRPLPLNKAIGDAHDRCLDLVMADDPDDPDINGLWRISDSDDPGAARLDRTRDWRHSARDAAIAAGYL